MSLDKSKTAENRFNVESASYHTYRPNYPKEITEKLENYLEPYQNHCVADIGCGTGLLSLNFLNLGCSVIGVDPNEKMLKVAEENLKLRYPNFTSILGGSGSTNIKNNTVDLIVSGQAFHWFDNQSTKKEFKRILKPEKRKVMLTWNLRDNDFEEMKALENIIQDISVEYKSIGIDIDSITEKVSDFFDKHYELSVYPNKQIVNYDWILGFLKSASYIPKDSDTLKKLEKEITKIVPRNGSEITFNWKTNVFIGNI